MGSVQEDFDGIFQHIQKYKIIVCERCAFAVVPQQIDRHLREHHPRIDKQNRSRIVERVRTLEAVAHNKEDVEYPQVGEEPVEGLEVFKDGCSVWDNKTAIRANMCAERRLVYRSTVDWNMDG